MVVGSVRSSKVFILSYIVVNCSHTLSGVHLMYKGEVFLNNSVILYDYDSNIGIHCVTNLRPCCTAPEKGEWYEHGEYHDRNVSSERISRYNTGTIAMVPLVYFAVSVIHQCILPNAANTKHHIYFGVYDLYNPGILPKIKVPMSTPAFQCCMLSDDPDRVILPVTVIVAIPL